MYTGGLDTTLAAYLLAEKFDKVHLLTFDFKSNLFINFSKKNVETLKNIFKKKIIHRIINIDNLIFIIHKNFFNQIIKYKSPFIYELGCRFAINIAALNYCLKNQIKFVGDGTSIEQNHWPEQGKEYINYVNTFFLQNGISYLTPVYNFGSRNIRRSFLIKKGFKLGPKIFLNLSFFLNSMQPFCLHDTWGSLFRRLNLFMISEGCMLSYFKYQEKNYLNTIH